MNLRKLRIVSAILAAIVCLVLALPVSAAGETPLSDMPTNAASQSQGHCNGPLVTIIATGAVVHGTPGDDVIIAIGDEDVPWGVHVKTFFIDSGAGNDKVCVWYANAVVDLGSGDDYFQNDVIVKLEDKTHKSIVKGGPGNDNILLVGANGSSKVDTGDGWDRCRSFWAKGHSKPKFKNCETVTYVRHLI